MAHPNPNHYSSRFPDRQGERVPIYRADDIPLPLRILSLDIETEKTRLRKVEESTIAVIGVVPYTLDADRHYRRGAYLHFLPDEISALHEMLAAFDGLILGQNLLDFDYRAMRSHMSLAGIVDKTFDLLFFLRDIVGGKGSLLSLEVLAKNNLRMRKLAVRKDIPALWRAGNVKEVLRRNERDCDLVAELWMKLINDRYLSSRHRLPTHVAGTRHQATQIHIDNKHLPILLGQMPFITHKEWMYRLRHWGNARRDPATGGKTIVKERVAPADLVVFHRMWCPDCLRHFVLRAGRDRIFKPRASKACPFCKRRLALSEGGTLIAGGDGRLPYWLGYMSHGGRGQKLRSEDVPSEQDAMALIRWTKHIRC